MKHGFKLEGEVKKIKIDGEIYQIIETLPPVSLGMKTKAVKHKDGTEMVAVCEQGKWRLWTWEDRLGKK